MESKEGVEALFLYAAEGILIADERGIINRINPSAEKLFGYEPNELVGKSLELLVPRRFAGSHSGHREKYNENPHARKMGQAIDLYGLRKDGSEIPVEISLSPYATAEGKFTIAFIVDITQRKQIDEKIKHYSQELEMQVRNRTMILEEAIQELEKTKQDLNMALEKERELNELKSRFVSMASHEFRTPLATIKSSLSLVKKYGELNDTEKQDKHISKIKSSISNLTDILNDFLSVSQLEEGKVSNLSEELNLPEYLIEITAELQTICKAGQKINYVHEGQDIVHFDRKLLRNILFNLVSNAIKFSDENSAIDIFTSVNATETTLKVSDHGVGITKQDQVHLFERFFRGRNVTHIQGTGLGLNIVARYVEMLNGNIKFESEENVGTTFTITLPYYNRK
jgi:PAS domain S-box-containing protein